MSAFLCCFRASHHVVKGRHGEVQQGVRNDVTGKPQAQTNAAVALSTLHSSDSTACSLPPSTFEQHGTEKYSGDTMHSRVSNVIPESLDQGLRDLDQLANRAGSWNTARLATKVQCAATRFSARPSEHPASTPAHLPTKTSRTASASAEIDTVLKLVMQYLDVPLVLVTMFDQRLVVAKQGPEPAQEEAWERWPLCRWAEHGGTQLVPDVLQDARLASEPPVELPGGRLRWFASIPLVSPHSPSGPQLGALCAGGLREVQVDGARLPVLVSFAGVLLRRLQKDAQLRDAEEQQGQLAPAMAAIRSAYQHLEDQISCQEQCMLLVDAAVEGFRVLYANDAWEKLTELTSANLAGTALAALMRGRFGGALLMGQHHEAAHQGKHFSVKDALICSQMCGNVYTLMFRPARSASTIAEDAQAALATQQSSLTGLPYIVTVHVQHTCSTMLASAMAAGAGASGGSAGHSGHMGSGGMSGGTVLPCATSSQTSPATSASLGSIPLLKLRISKQMGGCNPFEGLQLGFVLGRGSAGCVYSGKWFGCAVAVKVLDLDPRVADQQAAALKSLLGAELRHPHLVSTLRWALVLPAANQACHQLGPSLQCTPALQQVQQQHEQVQQDAHGPRRCMEAMRHEQGRVDTSAFTAAGVMMVTDAEGSGPLPVLTRGPGEEAAGAAAVSPSRNAQDRVRSSAVPAFLTSPFCTSLERRSLGALLGEAMGSAAGSEYGGCSSNGTGSAWAVINLSQALEDVELVLSEETVQVQERRLLHYDASSWPAQGGRRAAREGQRSADGRVGFERQSRLRGNGSPERLALVGDAAESPWAHQRDSVGRGPLPEARQVAPFSPDEAGPHRDLLFLHHPSARLAALRHSQTHRTICPSRFVDPKRSSASSAPRNSRPSGPTSSALPAVLSSTASRVTPSRSSLWALPEDSRGSVGAPTPEGDQVTKLWIMMEHADRGNLKDAIERGALHVRSEGGAEGRRPRLSAVLSTAREVASALMYLHSMGLVHGELTARNVLLASAGSSASVGGRGFVPKVTDAGLARALGPSLATMTAVAASKPHHPPELLHDSRFCSGALNNSGGLDEESVATTAADIWAFGVLLWQMYTGGSPRAAMQRRWLGSDGSDAASSGTEGEGASAGRWACPLQFPAWADSEYVALTQACLAHEAADRPGADAVCARLQRMEQAANAC